MSQIESCGTDDRKRKLDVCNAAEDSKKPKLNASLGLSLLQAYDEEQYSDEEDVSETLEEETSDKVESVSTKDIVNDQVIGDNLSSLIVEEEEEISLSSSDYEKIKFNEEITNPLDVLKPTEENSVDLKNGTIGSDGLEKTESKDQLDEAISNATILSGPIALNETVTAVSAMNVPPTIRPDYNFSVFGRNENLIEAVDNDIKPIKKVKLNRSKFVRPVDESSNDTKSSPTKSNSSVSDQISNILTVKCLEEKLLSDPTILDTSDSSVTEESSVMNVTELVEESIQEVNETQKPIDETIYHSFREESIIDCEENSVQESHFNAQGEHVLESSEEYDSIQPPTVLEETIDSEPIPIPEKTLLNIEQPMTNSIQPPTVLEETIDSEPIPIPEKTLLNIEQPMTNSIQPPTVLEETIDSEPIPIPEKTLLNIEQPMTNIPSQEKLEMKSTKENILDNELDDGESLNGDVSDAEKFVHESSEKATTEKLDDEKKDDNKNERAKSLLRNSETVHSSLEIMEELDEDLQVSENEKLEEDADEDLNKVAITYENRIENLLSSETVQTSVELPHKFNHPVSDEDVFEDAVETVEPAQNRKIQEPAESKPTELSKLEQALTGRLENFQSHLKKADNQSLAKEEIPNKELKQVVEDTKQNIKLHLSLQGDRVSIKSASSVSETPPILPVRVKRQYRKRQKLPGELEAKQASAKEYANRLRQRAERETPGAKKRGRKKKNANANSSEIILDPESNSSPNDTLEVASPLTVAINRLPSRKSNVAGKVQPIKLKICKNANVTIECTSKYDTSKVDEAGNGNSVDVSEKIVGILEEARKKDEPSSNYVEKASTSWSGPDRQRVERLLKESNITITPVVSGQDDFPQHTSVLEPILTSKEKFTPKAVESNAATSITPLNESDENLKNLTISLKADADTPWKIVKSPRNELNSSSIPTGVTVSKSVDVKLEIRKKITSVEKRKQDISTAEIEPMYKSPPKIETFETSVADLPSPSPDTDVLEEGDIDRHTEQVDVHTVIEKKETPEPSPMTTPIIHKTPSSASVPLMKLPSWPAELFPKKRGRPTKEMVAMREAYRQQQELLEKVKKESGEVDAFGDISLCSTPSTEPIKVKRGRKPKHERLEKKDSDDLSYDELPFDPAREAEEQRRLEEERMRREEERERKNELRRLKAKERSDLVKAKRLRQKMKAKERHKLAKELRRQQQEEKKKLEEQLKRLPVSMGFDDDTRMSAENSQAANMSFSIGIADDDSSGATNDLSQKLKKSRMEVTDSDSKDLMVDQIAEYQWPIQGGDLYMIQEQVSNFLGVKSFKRKYPDIWRRPVDSEERAYLVDSGLVSETLCDLGITAVRSAEVLDIMCSDFPEKYEEFRRYMREKQMKELSFKQRAWANGLGYKLLMADGSKQDMKKRAMESVSNWNSALNKSRVEDRRCHMDLQTFIIHYPKQRGVKMTLPSPKVGSYPVTILPGQFCDFYKEYTPTELRYMPVNTVLYGPLKHPTAAQNGDASQTDSDDSSSSDDSSTTSEDTQATEETLEDIDKDMVLEGGNIKFGDKDSSFVGEEEQTQTERNGDRNPLSENDIAKIVCKVCLGDQFRNKLNVPEVLISCSQCASTNHPTCLDLSLNIVPRIKSYAWQCPDCKICAQCKENADEDKMLFCDTCDRGFHIYCVGLIRVPAGNWQCKECSRLIAENNVSTAEVSVPKKSPSHFIEITG